MAAFNLTAQINLQGPSNVKKVVAGIQKQLSGLNANINLNISKNTVKTLADADVKLRQINTSLNKVSASAAKANSAVAQFAQTINSIGTGNVSIKIQNASNATKQLGNNAKTSFKNIKIARTEIEEFGRQSALAIRRFTAFASVTSVIYGVNNAINQALSDFIKFDRQLVRLSQVTGQSANNLKGLQGTIGELSTSFGVSSSSLAEVSVTLAQAGFSIKEVQSALKALALTDVSPTFDNLNQTVEGSIALLRQFSINASQLEASLGSINAVAAAFAVESSDIIAAVQRAGGVFAAASKGVSNGTDALNEFVAVFTSVRATTRESAETISTGLRTIFTRLQRESTIDALKEFGVNLQDAEGKFVGAFKAVQLLSEGLGSLDPRDIRFSKIVEELGGFRQIGKVIPLISQFATAQEALKVAQQGQDSLAASAAQAQAALAVQFARVREEFLKLVRDIAGTDSFKSLVTGALSLTSALIRVADAVKGVIPIIGLFAAARGASAIGQFAKGFGGGLRRTSATGFARGGTVPGSGNTDSVPAMLTPGEFVLRKSAVRSIGTEKLHRMNKYGSGDKVTMTGKQLSGTYKSLSYLTDPEQSYTATVQQKPVPTPAVLDTMKQSKTKNPRLPNWLHFETAVAKQYGLKRAGGNKFLDFPDSRPPAEAKFLRWGDTYSKDKETGFLRGNNNETLLAKLVGSGKYQQGWRNVVSYYPQSLGQIKKALSGIPKLLMGGLIKGFAFGGVAKDQAGFENIRQQILDKYQNLNMRITKRKGGFGYNILGGLKTGNEGPNQYSVFEQAKNLNDLTVKADQVASKLLYEYGPNIDKSLLKKMNKKSTRFATGGSAQDTVPAMLTPGEFVFSRESAKSIGYGNLRKMNTRPQGFNKGGIVGFANGGGPTAVSTQRGDIGLSRSTIDVLSNLEKALVSVNLPADQLTKVLTTQGKVDAQLYQSSLRQAKASLSQAKASAKSSDEITKLTILEQQLTKARTQYATQRNRGDAGKLLDKVTGEAGFYAATALTGLAVAAETSNTALGAGLAGAATNLAASLALVQGVSATMVPLWGLISAQLPGVAAGLTGMLVPLAPFAAVILGIVGGLALFGAGLSAIIAYQKKNIELEKAKATQKLDTANERAAKAMDKFAKDASAINFDAVNTAVGEQISSGEQFAQARSRQTQFETQGTGFGRELAAYLTLGYVDSIEDATRNNEKRVQDAAKDIVEANSEAFKNAQNIVFQRFQQGRSLRDIRSAAPGSEDAQALENLVNAALAADKTYQEQVQLAASRGKTLEAAVVEANKRRVESELFASGGVLDLRDKVEQAARAQEAFGRTQARLATSFERLNNVIQQSISRVQFESDARQSSIDGLLAIANGEARVAEIRSRAANVIENPTAYTERDRATVSRTLAANLTPGLGERQATEVAALATFDPAVIERSFTDVANNVAIAAKPSEVGEQIRENLAFEIDKLRAAGAEDTARALQEQANAQATILASKLEGVSDPTQRQKIIDETLEELKRNFNSVRDEAVKTAKAFEEFRAGALNQFSRSLQEVAKLQNEALKYEQAAIDANRSAADNINEALSGFGPSITELTRRQAEDTARLTGGPTDPAGIANNLTALGATSQSLNEKIQKAANAGDTNEVARLNERLIAVNRELNNNRQALEQLAESAGRAAEAALAEVNERKRLQDANRQFAETLLTSGPDELKKLDESLIRANQRLNGFIPQAGASQRKRFFELLKQTGSVRQASQGVAAETRAEDLKFLRETRDVRTMQLQDQFVNQGLDSREARRRAEELINNQESQILSQMGQEAGLGRLGQNIVGRAAATTADRRNDPTMVAAIDTYQQAVQVQIEANQQLRNLTDALASQVLVDSQNQLRTSIDDLNSTISLAEQQSGPIGVPRVGQNAERRQRGGLIYASNGQYINFEPKGTDTVPAMLTPGEFVVNRQATQKNMGLLQAINGGKVNTYSKGGKVAYLASGGFAQRDANKDGVITVGVEDASGLNDINRDGIITFAEFMTNQSLNDPKARDYINKVSQRLASGKNVSPINLLSNEQIVDDMNLFGPINQEYADYVKGGGYKKDLDRLKQLTERKKELEKIDTEKLREQGEFNKAIEIEAEREKIKQEIEPQNFGGRNFRIARQNMGGPNFNKVYSQRQQAIQQLMQQGMNLADATKKADDQIKKTYEFNDAQSATLDRMIDRRQTMENIRGTGGNLSTVRSGHQAGIKAARTDYLRTRNRLIKEGVNPVQASIQAQQSASETYYSARNNYFEKRAERKRKNNVGVDRNPRADQNIIEGNNVPVLLPERAGLIPTLPQLNAQVKETEAAVKQTNLEQQQNAAPKPAGAVDLLAQQDAARQNNERENARIKEEEKRRIEQQQQADAEQAKKDREDWAQKQAAALDAKIASKEKELADAQQRYDEAYGGWFGAVRNSSFLARLGLAIGPDAPSGLAIEVSDKEKEIFRLKRAKNAALGYGDGQIDTNEFSGPEGVRTFVERQSGLTEGRGAPGLTRYDRAGVRTAKQDAEFMAVEEQGIAATKAVVETGAQALGAVATLGASAVAPRIPLIGRFLTTRIPIIPGSATPTLSSTVTSSALSGAVTEGGLAYAEGESAAGIASRAAFSAGAGAVGAGLGYGLARAGSAAYRRFRPGQGPRIPMGRGASGGADDLVDPLRVNMDPEGAAKALSDFGDMSKPGQTPADFRPEDMWDIFDPPRRPTTPQSTKPTVSNSDLDDIVDSAIPSSIPTRQLPPETWTLDDAIKSRISIIESIDDRIRALRSEKPGLLGFLRGRNNANTIRRLQGHREDAIEALFDTVELSNEAQQYAAKLTPEQRAAFRQVSANASSPAKQAELFKRLSESAAADNLIFAEGADYGRRTKELVDWGIFSKEEAKSSFGAYSSLRGRKKPVIEISPAGGAARSARRQSTRVHELTHYADDVTGAFSTTQNYNDLQRMVGPDLDEFLDSQAFDDIVYGLNSSYTGSRIRQKPRELFTVLNQGRYDPRTRDLFTEGSSAQDMLNRLWEARGYNTGGIVYANNGALIPYQSRGTDTVPAMLTPGEFVINRQATSQHLPLLRAINNGYDAHSMMTNHLAKGGMVGAPQYLQQGGITRGAGNNGVSLSSKIEGLEEFQAIVAQLNEAMSGGAENMNNVVTQISQASSAFSATAQSVQAAALNIPDSVNVAQNVRVDGIPDTLNDFSANLLNSSVSQSSQKTNRQFNDLNTKNEGSLGLPSPNSNEFIA